jgi:tetratricopeptide (TPR) repeat protein
MVNNLLGTQKSDHEIEELILGKTEGVPFYIEELVKSLTELKVIERTDNTCHLAKGIKDVTIPSTIQGVIMARVDSLPDMAKEVLQTGSAIEREFTYELIKRVTNLTEKELLSCLSILKESELLYERGIYPDSTYIFKHALTRDVVYDSILKNKRKRLHEKIGNAVVDLYSNRAEQKPELLAQHYGLSESWEKAVRFGRLAAEKAYKYSQFQEAVKFYEMAIAWILKLPESKDQKEHLVDIQLEICWSNIGLGQFGKVEEVAKEAELTSKSLGDRTRLGIAYLGLGTAYVYRGNFEKTEHYALKAIKHLEGTVEERSLAIANLVLGACYIGQGLWKKSEPCFSKTIRIYEKLGLKTEYVMGWSALPYTIVCGQMGYNLAVIGRVAEGQELIERGYASELEKVSNLTTKMAYCSWQGLFISLIGEDLFNAAIKIDQLVEIAERSDSPFMILAFNTAKSNVMLGIENYPQVKSSCHKALKAIEGKSIRTGHVANVYYNLVLADLKLGDIDMAISHHEEGRSLVELAPSWWGPRYHFLEGLIHMHKTSPDYAKIEACFEKSIKDDEEVGALVLAAQTRYYLSKGLARKGKVERSLKMLKDLQNKFQEWEISVWQQKCKQELEPYSF